MPHLRTSLAATLLLLAGCRDADANLRPPDLAGRVLRPVAWDTAFSLVSTLQDTLFAHLGRLAAADDRVYAVDFFADRVMAFDTTGRWLWSFGQSGAGPGEFQEPMYIQLGPDGGPWILDAANARITVLSESGSLVREIPLARLDVRAGPFVPLSDDSIVVASTDLDDPFWLLDGEGVPLRKFPHPNPAFRKLPPMARQVYTGHDPLAGQWVVASALADGFASFRGVEPDSFLGWYPEVFAPPRVVETVTNSGASSTRRTELDVEALTGGSPALADSSIYILFAGLTENAGRLLDRYDRRTGSYRETLLLPETVSNLAVRGDRFYFVTNKPAPTLWSARVAR